MRRERKRGWRLPSSLSCSRAEIVCLNGSFGEAYRDPRATAGFRIPAQIAAVRFNEALGDRQAETGAAMLGAVTAALEAIEDAALLILRDADAVILDCKHHHAVLAPA